MENFKLIGLIFSIQILRYIFISVFLYWIIFISLKEKLSNYFIQTSNITFVQIKHEVKYSIITSLIFGVLFSILVHPIFVQHSKIYIKMSNYSLVWNVTSPLILIIINDAYFYFMHRALHHRIFFKRFHQIHHVSTNPTPLTAYSFHPIEAILEMVWIFPVVILIPIHKYILILYATISYLNNVKGHLGISFKYKLGNKILNSSVHHSQHHKYFNCNYGLYFLFWDRILKTEKIYDC